MTLAFFVSNDALQVTASQHTEEQQLQNFLGTCVMANQFFEPKKQKTLILKAFGHAIEQERYQGKWIPDDAWAVTLSSTFNVPFVVTPGALNGAISSHPQYANCIDGTGSHNQTGVYRHKKQLSKGRGRHYFYFVTRNLVRGVPPVFPKSGKEWITFYDQNRERKSQRLSVGAVAVATPPPVIIERGGVSSQSNGGDGGDDEQQSVGGNRETAPAASAPAVLPPVTDHSGYLFSSEARKVLNSPPGEEALATLKRRLDLFHAMLSSHETLVQHVNKALEVPLTHDQVARIRDQCQLLMRMYQICMEENIMDNKKKKQLQSPVHLHSTCVEKALEFGKLIIPSTPNKARALINWHVYFREKEMLPHPDKKVERRESNDF